MIGYITLGANDIKRSAAFYDKLLAEVGAKRVMEQDTFIVWGNSPTAATSATPTATSSTSSACPEENPRGLNL